MAENSLDKITDDYILRVEREYPVARTNVLRTDALFQKSRKGGMTMVINVVVRETGPPALPIFILPVCFL